MSFVVGGIIAGGAALAGAGINYLGTTSAANTESNAANNATELQYNEFQQQQANEAPWLAAGQAALPQLSQMAATTPSFTSQDFLNNQDPAYQFDLSQGEQAVQRSAAAAGGLQTGGTLKALNNYAQGAASNEYQNAYNRFMNNQNTQFSRLSSLAGIGQTATAGVNAAGMNMANNNANTITSLGSAQGAAQIAGSQNIGNTLSSLGTQLPNQMMQYQMLSNLGLLGGGGLGSLGANQSLATGQALGAASAPVGISPGFGSQFNAAPSPVSLLSGS